MNDPTNDNDVSNVVDLPVVTRLKIDPDRILAQAKGMLTDVVLLGYDKDGKEYFGSSNPNGPDVLWLMERLKLSLLTVMTTTDPYID